MARSGDHSNSSKSIGGRDLHFRMKKNYHVTHSFNNEEQNRCVDIIRNLDLKFRFQEWRRDPEDISGWFLMLDSLPNAYTCETEAIAAAKQAVAWFNNLTS